jgi:hypothetical protein
MRSRRASHVVVRPLNCSVRRQFVDAIAERHLELRTDGASVAVVVKLGRPTLDASGENWVCEYEVWFGDSCRSMAMHGVDALQALQLSIATLDVELEHGARKRNGSLYHYDKPFVSVLEGGNLRVVPAA